MTRIVRAAMTQTRNAYAPMPTSVAGLSQLAGCLDQVRNANVEHHVDLIRAAQGSGAQIVGLGELFCAPYFALEKNEMWRQLAENAESGPTVSRLREIARELSVVLVAPIYELDSASGTRFNTAVIIEADGSILGKYRKAHIPQGSNEMGSFAETFYYDRSDWPSDANCGPDDPRIRPVFQSSVGRVGVVICYDRHFEGMMSALARRGAEIVFSPAVTFGAKSQRMWHLEFPVEAARHGIYIGGSNRMGAEPPWNVEYFGESYFCGPDGKIDSVSRHENLIMADLDLDALAAPDSSGWDLKRDERKPD